MRLLTSILFVLAFALPVQALQSIELSESNSVIFYGEVSPALLATTITDVIKKQIGGQKVYLVIYSPGGMIDGGDLFSTAFSALNNVEIVIIRAWSMAAAVSQCPKIKRLIHKNGTLMFHECYRPVSGLFTAADLELMYKAAKEGSDNFNKLCRSRMKLTEKQYADHIRGTDWWLSAEDAVTVGAAEEIVDVKCGPGLEKFSPTVISLENPGEVKFEPFCKILNSINQGN